MSKYYPPLSVVVSTRKINDKFVDHIKKMFSHPKTEFIIRENNGEMSLAKLYNTALKESTNDIVVFLHDDLMIETKNLTPKINRLFEENPHGIIGVAGTDNLTSGVWWENRDDMYGVVGHVQDGKKHVNQYSKQMFPDKVKDVVVVDGVFFMVHKQRIKHGFNEDFRGFHFYDLPICVENYLSGVGVGVTTKIRITHFSIGQTNKKWEKNKLFFEAIYEKNFPLKIVS